MTSLKVPAAVLAAALTSAPLAAFAEDAPADPRDPAAFQLSLWDSAQIIDSERSVHGARLALPYGRNWDVYGLDVGIVNSIDHDLEGVQFSIVGVTDNGVKGVQYNLLWSSAGGHAQGFQSSAVTSAGSLTGVQIGAVNYVRDTATGVGLGIVNAYEGQSKGAQIGVVNYASRIEGFQFGLVNVTGHLHGVQIGLVNVASNGFLPVFPIVNAAL